MGHKQELKITTKEFILKACKPFKWQILVFIMTSIIWSVDLSLSPYLIKTVIDAVAKVIEHKAGTEIVLRQIIFYLLLALTVLSSKIIYEYTWLFFFNSFKIKIGNELIAELFTKSYDFYQNNFAGGLSNYVNSSMGAIPTLIRVLLEDYFGYFLALIIALYSLWLVDYKISLLFMSWIISYLTIALFIAPKIKKLSALTSKEASKGMGHIIDILTNILSVKLFSVWDKEKRFINNNFNRWKKLSIRTNRLFINIYSIQLVIFFSFQCLSLYFLFKGVQANRITAGDFVLVFSIASSINGILLGIVYVINHFNESLGNLNQAIKVIYQANEIKDKEGAKQLTINKGNIVFEKLGFSYDQGKSALFSNLSVKILDGQKVGLVGYSGGGKTSFVNLILRLYEISEGSILIDNQDIRDVTQDSLRRAIAMIPQEPVLFHRTLLENIRYGRIEATDEEVIAASKRAYAHEFISKLPENYHTLVGERGIKLSGGQRQRIAIARAILKNAPILILDEATSQLDSVTEEYIQTSLAELMQGKTTIVIAHRLSTLLHMDRILVFDQGKIIQDGTHAELLAQAGLYKTLWDAQVGGFLPDKQRLDFRS
jgi:ATP-binding cassette subfamily B protein